MKLNEGKLVSPGKKHLEEVGTLGFASVFQFVYLREDGELSSRVKHVGWKKMRSGKTQPDLRQIERNSAN